MMEDLNVLKNLLHNFSLCSQEENPETIPTRNPEALKVFHQKFKYFQCLSVTRPDHVVSYIQELWQQWLQPETYTKEETIEQLMLEQFLSTLPENLQTLVRSKHPQNSREAAALVPHLIQTYEVKDFPIQDFALAEKQNTRQHTKKNTMTADSLPPVGSRVENLHLDILVKISDTGTPGWQSVA